MVTHFDMRDGCEIGACEDDAFALPGDQPQWADDTRRAQPRLLTVREASADLQTGPAVIHPALLQLSAHRFDKF